MVMGFLFITYLIRMNKRNEFMKVSGKMIRKTVWDLRSSLMDQYITGTIKTTSLKEEESLRIIKDKFMKDNGKME